MSKISNDERQVALNSLAAQHVGVCNCSMFCCTLLYVYSSIAIMLMGKRELVALLNLSFWCIVMVKRLFLAEPRGCLRFVIVVFPDHTHYFWVCENNFKLIKTMGSKRCNRFCTITYFCLYILNL